MDGRLVLGLSAGVRSQEVHAALLRVRGAGWSCQPELLGWSSQGIAEPVPATAPGAHALASPGPAPAGSGVAAALVEATRAVCTRAQVPLHQILLAGWSSDSASEEPAALADLSATLAEVTGATVIGGFAARDRASGGRGRLIGAIIDWLLARAPDRSRVVLHLGWAATLTYLPAGAPVAGVSAFECGPGLGLLDAFVRILTRGAQSRDPRGMLAVQGRQLKPLVRRWAAHPFLRLEPPKHLTADDFAATFIEETIGIAAERNWSLTDILCTATHFLACCPADAMRRFLAHDPALKEVLYAGPGAHNPFLIRLIEEQLRGVGCALLPLGAAAAEAYEAVAAGLLAALALDGVEANLPNVTGAAGPRLLGHFTPGSPANWAACIDWLHYSVEQQRKLRAA